VIYFGNDDDDDAVPRCLQSTNTLNSVQTTSCWSPSLRELICCIRQHAHCLLVAVLQRGISKFTKCWVLLDSNNGVRMHGQCRIAHIHDLPDAANLRKRVIHFVLDGDSAHMAHALSQNGSLHFLSMSSCVDPENVRGSDATYFTPREHSTLRASFLVGSYCQRNKCLPTLLASIDHTTARNVTGYPRCLVPQHKRQDSPPITY
jgi:hypothetical protein